MTAVDQWSAVLHYLQESSAGESLAFEKDAICHPREAGALVSIGLPVGQLADYRFPPESGCRGLHVHEHPYHWVAHLELGRPKPIVTVDLTRDATAWYVVGGAALGAALGTAMTKKSSGAVAGAGLGLLAAALLLLREEE